MIQPAAAPTRVQHHYLLDLARFGAAFAVVLWHYQHFFWVAPDTPADGYRRDASPFFDLLAPAYHYGALGVPFFFALSGFVFFWLYRTGVAEGRVSASVFSVRRFARLYPLHLATLLYIAALQALSADAELLYAHNDLKHFVLNLFLASSWGMEDGFSFNGPVWSVSVEVLLYAAFFVLARFAPTGWATAALGLALGAVVATLIGNESIGWALVGFFAGGACALLYRQLAEDAPRAGLRLGLLAALPLAAGLCGALLLALPWGSTGWQLALYAGLFPALILWTALLQATMPRLGRRAAWLGDLSYGIYLLHVPVTLTILAATGALGLRIDYTSEAVFLLYIAFLLVLARLVYTGFERPMRDWLRTRLDYPVPHSQR